jgi:osmoprotectant transport system permease protein
VGTHEAAGMINDIITWLGDPAHWPEIQQRVGEHLVYSVVAVAIAAVIAIPAGLWVGHTGRGRFVVVNLAGAARAIPSLGLLYFIVLWLGPKISGDLAFVIPNLVVLVVLAIPPLLSGTYAGIEEVDPAARDAAAGMGMRGWQVLLKVEAPCALPLIFSGLRSSFLQVISTATIAATAALGGLGRFLIDGLSVRDYPQMAAGAVLVAALAVVVDVALALLQRLVTSPGVSGQFGRRHRRATAARPTDTSPTVSTRPENVVA